MTQLAPIIMFVYSRPDLTQNTLNSLAQNKEAQNSDLFIFADGPKLTASDTQKDNINKVRTLIAQQTGFKSVTIKAAEKNMGLANSVIAGVTEIVNQYGKVIIVEDDVSLSPYFLKFMNDALNLYEFDGKVSGIGSWNYFFLPPENSNNFFLRHPDTIAWATFKRAWDLFNPDADFLINEIKKRGLTKAFNMENSIDLMKMLHRQKEGKVDSWAVRWTASVFLQNMLTLYPQRSLTRHEGNNEGTHFSSGTLTYDQGLELCSLPLNINKNPAIETQVALKAYVRFHKKHHSFFNKVITKLKNFRLIF